MTMLLIGFFLGWLLSGAPGDLVPVLVGLWLGHLIYHGWKLYGLYRKENR